MAESQYSYSVLDVGQGSMQLIEEGDETNITIDCNISGAPEFVKRYLGLRRVNHIDLHIFSGTDQDHADADGFQMLINKTDGDIREIWYPDFPAKTDNWKAIVKLIDGLKEKGTTVRRPKAGEYFKVGGFAVKVPSPHDEDSDTSNNASIVVKIIGAASAFSVLETASLRTDGTTSSNISRAGYPPTFSSQLTTARPTGVSKSQRDDRLPYRPADLVPQVEVAAYPTDFSRMTDDNITKLSLRGEVLTRLLIKEYCPEL